MRDFDVADMIFTDINGKSFVVKEMREYPTDVTLRQAYKVRSEDTLDLIAVKQYGEGTESDSYKIFDYNREAIVDNQFSLKGIKSIGIPN